MKYLLRLWLLMTLFFWVSTHGVEAAYTCASGDTCGANLVIQTYSCTWNGSSCVKTAMNQITTPCTGTTSDCHTNGKLVGSNTTCSGTSATCTTANNAEYMWCCVAGPSSTPAPKAPTKTPSPKPPTKTPTPKPPTKTPTPNLTITITLTPTQTVPPTPSPTPTPTSTPPTLNPLTVKIRERNGGICDFLDVPISDPFTGAKIDVSAPDVNDNDRILGPSAFSFTYTTPPFSSNAFDDPLDQWKATIHDLDPTWVKTCPTGPDRVRNIGDPGPNEIVFVVQKNTNAWWQTVGGDVGANSGDVTSILPDPAIFASMSDPGMDDGVLLYNDYGYNLSWGSAPRKFSDRNLISGATGKPYDDDGLNKEGFDHFSLLLSPEIQTLTLPVDASIPSGVYLTGSALPISSFTLAGNKKVVLLVNNSVTITGDITVIDGSFFAVIAKNKITIQPGVTNVQGIYIADDQLVVSFSGDQLTGEGMFIGWAGVDLSRTLGSLNSTTPAEKFIYRPDFLLNAPDWFKQSRVFGIELYHELQLFSTGAQIMQRVGEGRPLD
jgi:hypothetical protein